MVDAPHVGVELLQHEEDGPSAIPPKPVPSPPSMSAVEKAKHDLTHQPPHPGCAICRSTRSPNMQHPQSHEHMRTIPLLVGDYCFLRDAADAYLATCLVLRLYPYRLFLAFIVPRKGSDPSVVARISRFIREAGLVHFAYRCDREASLNNLVEEAIAKAGRTGKRVHTDQPLPET